MTRCRSGAAAAAAAFCAALFLGAAAPAFPQQRALRPAELAQAMGALAEGFADMLPLYAALGHTWPGGRMAPPAEGWPLSMDAGGSFGISTMDARPWADMMGALGIRDYGISDYRYFPLPALVFEWRLGGLPPHFDIGLKIGAIPSILPVEPFSEERHFMAGAELRTPWLDEGRAAPAICFGVGFAYLRGRMAAEGPRMARIDIPPDTLVFPGASFLALHNPRLVADWSAAVLDLSVQASKTLGFVTPHLGLGASHAWSRVSVRVDSSFMENYGHFSGGTGSINAQTRRALAAQGIGLCERGISIEERAGAWGLRAFGGVSFDAAGIIRLDLAGLYEIRGRNFAVMLGARSKTGRRRPPEPPAQAPGLWPAPAPLPALPEPAPGPGPLPDPAPPHEHETPPASLPAPPEPIAPESAPHEPEPVPPEPLPEQVPQAPPPAPEPAPGG